MRLNWQPTTLRHVCHTYDEDEFWSKYRAFKQYVIQESEGDVEPAEKADIQLIEATLKETTPSSDS